MTIRILAAAAALREAMAEAAFRATALLAMAAAIPCTLPASAAAHTFGPPTALNTNAASDSGDDNSPRVATNGAGLWVALWGSVDSLGDTIGTDSDILVSRSTDHGRSWTTPAPLDPNADEDVGWDSYPQMTTNGTGTWVALWTSTLIKQYTRILVSRSVDDGASWSPPTTINPNAANNRRGDWAPHVATDGAGVWVVAWMSYDKLGDTLGNDTDILFARSTDGGATWSAPAALNRNAATDVGSDAAPQVATDGAGNWMAIWNSSADLGGTIGTDHDILVSRSSDGGATWTEPKALNANAASDSGNDYRPKVASDGAGSWVVIWTSWDDLGGTIGSDADVLVSRSSDRGLTWTEPEAVNTNADTDSVDEYNPQVATDRAGRWLVVWGCRNDPGGTIGTDYDILMSRSGDHGATWSEPKALTATAATDSGWDDRPQVTANGAGRWVAVWDSTDKLGHTIGRDRDILVSRALTLCHAEPATTCAGSFDRGSLLVDERVAGKEKLVARFRGGPALRQADFGDPRVDGGTAFGLCVYDGDDKLVGTLQVDRAGEACGPDDPCWRTAGQEPPKGKGYIYEDQHAAADGVSKLFVKGRRAPRSQALVRAQNHAARGLTSLPTGIAGSLVGQTRATVQLVTSDAVCLSMDLTDILASEFGRFRARVGRAR